MNIGTLLSLTIGLVFLAIYIVLVIVKIVREKSILTVITISLFITSLISVSASVYFTLTDKDRPKSIVENGHQEEDGSIDITENEDDLNLEEYDFEPDVKLNYPIVNDRNISRIEDADGTIYRPLTMITSDGVRAGFAGDTTGIVAFPESDVNKDGKLPNYKAYSYFDGNYLWVIGEKIVSYQDYDTQTYDFDELKVIKKILHNDKPDMELYDFVFDYLPVQKPKERVHVPMLVGDWKSKEDSQASLNFGEDGTLYMEHNRIDDNEYPYLSQYTLERLAANAYKLYLYPASVKADSAGGEMTVNIEPAKRNYIIYLTGESTFEFVFYNKKLQRESITMEKVN